MTKHLPPVGSQLHEAVDPSYDQETFYFTLLIAMSKERGGSRDETKNDIRALPEVLTVTLVEPEKGGIQRDLGTKYLSTLKLHVRLPTEANKGALMQAVVVACGNLSGITVLRFKETKPKTRRKQFYGSYKITEGDYQALMKRHKGRYAKMKKRLIGSGGNRSTGGGKGWTRPSMRRGKNAPIGFGAMEEGDQDALYEDILVSIGEEHKDLLAFDVQHSLNQKLWDGETGIRAGVKGAILDIVEEFIEGLDLELDVKDIVVTGSLANYNWSKFSDIDIHIIVDFEEVNDNKAMVKKFFDAVRSNWNKRHNILVKGHEVEIYVQDEVEPHISTGVYSLTSDRWLVKPKKIKPEIDRATATKKMKQLGRDLDKLSAIYYNEEYEEALRLAERIKEKIKRMRRSGLERHGIYAPENLAFKMLRRSGDIERLFAMYTGAYDELYSLDQ